MNPQFQRGMLLYQQGRYQDAAAHEERALTVRHARGHRLAHDGVGVGARPPAAVEAAPAVLVGSRRGLDDAVERHMVHHRDRSHAIQDEVAGPDSSDHGHGSSATIVVSPAVLVTVRAPSSASTR